MVKNGAKKNMERISGTWLALVGQHDSSYVWLGYCFQPGENGEIEEVYPARVKFRGFNEETNTQGYIKVSEYLSENMDALLKEAKE